MIMPSFDGSSHELEIFGALDLEAERGRRASIAA